MMNKVKVLGNGVTIPSKYIKDIERLADRVRRRLDDELVSLGLPFFSSDIIYRVPAVCKGSPIHYCYVGDFSTTRINYGDSEWSSPKFIRVRSYHSRLLGFAEVVWGLGGQLTFGDDGKHTVFFNGSSF